MTYFEITENMFLALLTQSLTAELNGPIIKYKISSIQI